MIKCTWQKDFRSGSLFSLLLLGLFTACQPAQSTEVLKAQVGDTTALFEMEEVDTLPVRHTIIGVGDMMLGTNYPSANYLPANGGKDLLKDVQSILQNADVTFGNL